MIFLLGLALSAEPSLDYDAAKERLLQLGVDSLTARSALEATSAALGYRRLAWTPDLSYSAAASDTIGPSGQSPSLSASLQSDLSLYNGGANRAALRSASSEKIAAEAQIQLSHQTALHGLILSLSLLQEARQQVLVEEAHLQAATTRFNEINAAFAAGSRTLADQLSARADIASATSSLLQARLSVRNAELSIDQLLRLDPLEAPLLPAPPILVSLPLSPPEAIARALAQRPEIIAAQALLDQRNASLAIAQSGYLPSINLGFRATENSQTGPSASAGLSVDGSIWDRGASRASVAEARASLQSQSILLEDLTWQIKTQVLQAIATLETERMHVETVLVEVTAAEEALRVVEARYRAGAALYAEVSAADAAFLSARHHQITAEGARLRAQADFLWALGETF